MSRRAAWGFGARVWRRRLTTEPTLAVLVALTTLMTATFVSVVPRLLERATVDDLRQTVSTGEPEQRHIRFEMDTRVGRGPADDQFERVRSRSAELLENEFPPSVRSIVQDTQALVDSPRFIVSSFPDRQVGPFPTTFHFRYQEGIEDHLELVDGRLPEAAEPVKMLRGRECPEDVLAVDDFVFDSEIRCRVERVPVFEAAVTARTAADMDVAIGDRVILTADPTDRRWINETAEVLDDRLILSISGIISLSDPGLEYWYADSRLHRPRIIENPDQRLVFGAGLMEANRYGQLLREISRVDNRYTWRFFIDPDLITAEGSKDLATDLEKIAPEDTDVITRLPQLIDEHLDQRASTIGLLSTATTGVAAAAMAVLAALSALIASRQRSNTRLIVDRGASRAQVVFDRMSSAAIMVGPAALIGWAITRRMFPDTESGPSTAATAGLAVVGLAAVIGPAARSRTRASASVGGKPDSAFAGRRLVVETLIVVLAVGAVVLLRRRQGIDGEGGRQEFDGLLALTPALLAVAAAMVAVRLYRPMVDVAAGVASRRSGAVGFIGLRRVSVQPLSRRIPIMVTLIAVAVAVFSATLGTSLAAARTDHSWQEFAADYRIQNSAPGAPLPPALDPDALGISDRRVRGVDFPNATIATEAGNTRVDVVALDAAASATLLAESDVRQPSTDGLATHDSTGGGPTPALISVDWPPSADLEEGDVFTINFGSGESSYVVDSVVDGYPGVDGSRPFVIVDLATLQRNNAARRTDPTFLLFNGPASDGPPVGSAIERDTPDVQLLSRHDLLDQIAGDGFSVLADRSVRVVFTIALMLAVVGAWSAVAVSAEARRRELGLLRTLGLTGRQARALTFVEELPTVVATTVSGIGAGVAIAVLLGPVLRIDALSGSRLPTGTVFDPVSVVLLAMLLVTTTVVATVLAVLLERRSETSRILRAVDDDRHA